MQRAVVQKAGRYVAPPRPAVYACALATGTLAHWHNVRQGCPGAAARFSKSLPSVSSSRSPRRRKDVSFVVLVAPAPISAKRDRHARLRLRVPVAPGKRPARGPRGAENFCRSADDLRRKTPFTALR